jgi:hypothetical protein
MSEPLSNPIDVIVPNLVTCINNRINLEKFANAELLELLALLFSYGIAVSALENRKEDKECDR